MKIKHKMQNLLIAGVLSGCNAGHQDFVDFRNDFDIGREIMFKTSSEKFSRAGEFIRGDFVLGGDGLMHISNNDKGQLVYHVFVQENCLTQEPKKNGLVNV